jgi:hypothetical protein
MRFWRRPVNFPASAGVMHLSHAAQAAVLAKLKAFPLDDVQDRRGAPWQVLRQRHAVLAIPKKSSGKCDICRMESASAGLK